MSLGIPGAGGKLVKPAEYGSSDSLEMACSESRKVASPVESSWMPYRCHGDSWGTSWIDPESPTTMWLISQISREVKEDRRIQAES